MTKLPTSLVTAIGTYELFEPVVVESAEVGRPATSFDPGPPFGAAHANLYRVTHQLLTLAFALSQGAAEPRRVGDEIPAELLSGLFRFGTPDRPPALTAATAIVLGERLTDGARRGTVICEPDAIAYADDRWRVHGGNVMPDATIPASGSMIPEEQRIFRNQGLPMRTLPDRAAAAEVWRTRCGFEGDLATTAADSLRWIVPEDATGLALPVVRGGTVRLVFPDPVDWPGAATAVTSPALEFEPATGVEPERELPGLLPYRKTGF